MNLKKFFSTESTKDYLTEGKKFFFQGKYSEAGQEFQNLIKEADILHKDDLDKVVSTFIKLDDTYHLNETLPKLPSDYTIFATKYSILHLAAMYNKPNVIVLLAQKGLLENQLLMKNTNGLNPIETAILGNNHKFFGVVKANLSKNFDMSKILSHESAKSFLMNTHANSNLHQAVDSFYNPIKILEEDKNVVHSNNSNGISEEILLGSIIESADDSQDVRL